MSGQKYTDTDVRHDQEEYTEIALGYLQNYQGSFEALLETKELAKITDLKVQQIRMVLNCMLADANVVNMPRFPRKFYDAQQQKFVASVPQSLDDTGEWEPPEIETYGDPRDVPYRPPWVDMKSKWNYSWGISLHKAACVVHIVDHKSPAVRWFPHIEKLNLQLRWLCSAYTKEANVKLVTYDRVDKLIANGWHPCRTCTRLKDREYVVAKDRESR